MVQTQGLGTVLVIEDEIDVRNVVSLTLSSWGYEVVDFADGTTAKDYLMQVSYDECPQVAVIDLNLPGLSGAELCRWLKSGSISRDISILILTADATDKQKISLIEGGADDYLTKPFDISDLRNHVDSLMRMRENKRTLVDQQSEEDSTSASETDIPASEDQPKGSHISTMGSPSSSILFEAPSPEQGFLGEDPRVGAPCSPSSNNHSLASAKQDLLNCILYNLSLIERSHSGEDVFGLAIQAIRSAVRELATSELEESSLKD